MNPKRAVLHASMISAVTSTDSVGAPLPHAEGPTATCASKVMISSPLNCTVLVHDTVCAIVLSS
eukprot:COSAG06_NODE_2693_length_6442_cov_5.906826_12_plen_63_part_01